MERIDQVTTVTRMHFSRMRTARGSSRPWRVSASVHAGIHTPPPLVWAWRPPWCGPGDPPECGPGDPLGVGLETPWVWTWRPPLARPLNFPPGCGPGDPLPGDLQGVLGYHLQGMLGYHLQGMLGYHPPSPPEQNS